MSTSDQRDSLLEQNADLRAENATLRLEKVRRNKEAFVAQVAYLYGVTPSVANFLVVLYAADGKALTNEQINRRLPEIGQDREEIQAITLMKVYACLARKATSPEAIVTIRHIGYAMSSGWIERLRLIEFSLIGGA